MDLANTTPTPAVSDDADSPSITISGDAAKAFLVDNPVAVGDQLTVTSIADGSVSFDVTPAAPEEPIDSGDESALGYKRPVTTKEKPDISAKSFMND